MPNLSALTEQLLTENSQFPTEELQLNHDAIAILLRDRFRREAYVLAGTGDLRALLPKLPLDEVDSDALIIIRPYIHTMGLYIRNINGQMHCFIFDSQAWGLRYYPIRLIIDALSQHLGNNSKIYLSNVELQSKNKQRGCVLYSIKFLDYCHNCKQGFFDNFENITSDMYDQRIPFSLVNELPTELNILDENHFKDDLLTKLNQQINYFYTNENGGLDLEKVQHTRYFMQGIYLDRNPNFYTQPSLYHIQVDLYNSTITIRFFDKNYLYENGLIYSQVLCPGDRANSETMILQGVDDVSVRHQDMCFIIKTDKSKFISLPVLLKKEAENLYQNHMRQSGMLLTLADEIADAIDLALIKVHGMGQDQVQLALRHVFHEQKHIYVPTIEELSEQLNLPEYAKSGYTQIVFSLNDGKLHQHQMAVLIELKAAPEQHIVNIINSANYHFTTSAKDRIKALLDGQDYEIIEETYSYAQKESWACGIYTIAYLESRCKQLYFDANQVEKLLEAYFIAYKIQKGALEIPAPKEISPITKDKELSKDGEKEYRQFILSLLTALSLAVESAECKKALVKKFLDWIKLHENISELFAVVDFSYNEHAKHFKQGIFTKEEVITYVHNAIVNIAKNYQADEQNKIKSQSKNKSNMPSMQEAIKNNFIKFGLKVPCEETITAISDSEHLLAFCSLFSKGFIQSAGGIENFYKSIGDFDGFYQGFTRYNCKGDKGYNFILILLLSKIQIGYRWQFLEYLIDNVNALGNLAKLWDILFINNTKNQEEKKTILTFLLEDLIVYKDSDTLLAEKIHILLYERAMLAEFIERYGVEWLVNIYKLCEESKKQLVSYRVSLYGKHNMQCMRNAHKFFECIDRPLSEIYEYCYKHIRIILDTLIRNFTPEHKDELRDICNGVNSRDEVFTHQLQVNLIFYFYLKTQDKYLSLIKNMLNSTLEKIKKETCIKILYQVICKNEYGRAGDFITLYIKSMNASITCWSQDKDFIYKFILLYLRDVAFKKNNYQFSPFEKIIKNPVLLDVKMLLNLLRDLQKEDSEFRKQIEILLKKIRGMDLYPKFLAAVKMNLIQEISQVIQPCIHDNRIFSSTFKPGLAQKMEALLNAPGEDTLDFAIDLCCLFKDMKTPDSIQAIQKAQQFLKTYSEQKSYITTLENEVASNKFM